jgi:hypothetical protein
VEQIGRLTGAQGRVEASNVLAGVDATSGSVPEQVAGAETAIVLIDRIAARVDDEIDRLSVLRMKESLRLLAGPPRGPETGGVLLGLAAWDGTLHLDEQYVSGPLRRMYESAGAKVPIEVLRRYRFALSEMFHQESHLLTATGTTYADSRAAFADPAVRLLELGVTAAWTARHLGTYLEALGIPQVAPGIEQVDLPDGYPSCLPAAVALAEVAGQRAGIPADEVLRRLNVVAPAAKLSELTMVLLTASGLAQVVPPANRPTVAQRVAQAMRSPLAAMAALDVAGSNEAALQVTSAAAGRACVEAGVQAIEAVRSEYGGRGGAGR